MQWYAQIQTWERERELAQPATSSPQYLQMERVHWTQNLLVRTFRALKNFHWEWVSEGKVEHKPNNSYKTMKLHITSSSAEHNGDLMLNVHMATGGAATWAQTFLISYSSCLTPPRLHQRRLSSPSFNFSGYLISIPQYRYFFLLYIRHYRSWRVAREQIKLSEVWKLHSTSLRYIWLLISLNTCEISRREKKIEFFTLYYDSVLAN